jgi:hypothetical protein
MSYPSFVITQAANQAITGTVLSGLRVDISEFRLGSDFSTPASPLDEGLQGSTIYTAVPSSYYYYDENTIGIRLEIDAGVGPFEFGEIGLFSQSGMMVARASLGSLQQKYGPSGGGMPNIWKIVALVRFSQAPSLFIINTSLASALLEVAHFGLLQPPGMMPSGQNAVIVHEPSPNGESIFAYAHSPTHWTLMGYQQIGFITLSATSSPGEIPSPDWDNFVLQNYQTGKYLVQTLAGDIRSIASVTAGMGNPTVSMPVLPAGSVLELYGALDQKGIHTNVPPSQFNDLVNEFNTYWGAPTGSSVVDAKGIGQPPVPNSADPLSVQDAEWWIFTDRVRDYARLVGLSNPVDIRGLTSDWSTNYFPQLRKYNSLCDSLNAFSRLRPGQVPVQSTDQLERATISHAGPWDSLHLDTEFAFVDEVSMRAFFNAGGWLGFKLNVVPDNYTQLVQANTLSALGMIRLTAAGSDNLGSLKIQWEEGDGVLTDIGNCGFLGLTGGWKTLWTYSFVASTGVGAFADEGTVTYRLQGMRIGPILTLRFEVSDTGRQEFVNDSGGGNPFIHITVVTARPSAGLISDTPLVHPDYSVLPSSVWV